MSLSPNHASSGIDGLDQILNGGFYRGQLYLIRGNSGAGKTPLSLQFLMNGADNGEKVLYLGTSETTGDIHRVADSHGWSLDNVVLYHHEVQEFGAEQTILHPAELELPQTVSSLLSVVEDVAPTRLVIDSLAEIRVLARDELWYRRQLMMLKQYFASRHCTVLLVEIPLDEQSMLDSIVSGVVELEQATPLYGPDRRRLRVNKVRGQDFTSGYHDYKIRRGGIDVFPRLIAAEHRQTVAFQQITTGLAAIDAMLAGGLVRGTSTLLLGPSGTGKSLLATQFAVAAAARGERSLFYVFDERVQTLLQRAEGVGLPLRHYLDRDLIRIRQVDPAELTSGELNHLMKIAVEHDGVRMLIIDSLNGYGYAMPEERMLGVYLHELGSYLNQQAVTSVFTMTQHGLVSEHIEQTFDISYVADIVFLFRHFEFAGEVHKALSVYKNRSSAHETAIRELRIDAGGIHLGEPLRRFQGILGGSPTFLGHDLDGHHPDAE